MIIPNTKRHPNNTKTDQLPISEVITGLPRPYHHTLSKKHQHLKIKWVKKSKKRPPKKNKKKENGTLAGARTRVFKLKGAPKLFGPAACFFSFFGEKFHRVTHGACTCDRHAAGSAPPNLDYNVPQTCPCTWNPELWLAVRFSKRCVPAKK